MQDAGRLDIELNAAEAAYVAQQVARGRFRSADEVVSAALAALRAQDSERDAWLSQVVGPAYDRMQAEPRRGIPAEIVFAELEELLRDPAR